jgi:hypothetical protein
LVRGLLLIGGLVATPGDRDRIEINPDVAKVRVKR